MTILKRMMVFVVAVTISIVATIATPVYAFAPEGNVSSNPPTLVTLHVPQGDIFTLQLPVTEIIPKPQPLPPPIQPLNTIPGKKPDPTPVVVKVSPKDSQQIAYRHVTDRGWDDSEYQCLLVLWQKESGWNHLAKNKSSGAYGIPQSLPGNKMASVAADWETNPETQIIWGLNYIAGRYKTPCGAWDAFQNKGWY